MSLGGIEAGWGRYTQADPVGLRGGLNTFVYALNRPVSVVDPRGLTPAQSQFPPPLPPFEGLPPQFKLPNLCKDCDKNEIRKERDRVDWYLQQMKNGYGPNQANPGGTTVASTVMAWSPVDPDGNMTAIAQSPKYFDPVIHGKSDPWCHLLRPNA